MFSPWRDWRRRRLLRRPFADDWLEMLNRNVQYYARLTAVEQAKLRDDLRILVAEKHWEGCGGLLMTDEIKVTIAAQAALLLLGFHDEYFDMMKSILVYPNAYVAPGHTVTRGGVVLEGESHRGGEAWYRGPVILSWADTLASGRDETDGVNLVLHEFAHQLDMKNGRMVDGTPALATRVENERWQAVIHAEFRRLELECQRGQQTLLDCYGATNIGEFFAVSTECFFERPRAMSEQHPDLYDILQGFYRQDPATRFE